MRNYPWIHSAAADLLFILLPPVFCLGIIMLFPQWFGEQQPVNTATWVVLVLCIDVAHVYSTLYRTYFDKELMRERKLLLLGIPAVCYIAGVLLCIIGIEWFWRVLAYVAVFHFVRQQYGFLRIYSRYEPQNWMKKLDAVAVYSTMLYPLLWWHLHPGRAFSWFVPGDFIQTTFPATTIAYCAALIYAVVIATWLAKEIWFFVKLKHINIPRFILLGGTAVSWYFGIVHFNGDMTFTLLNVVSHGIPYMALIWMYGRKNYKDSQQHFLRKIFSPKFILLFAGILLALAFTEEWLWDIFVWQDHPEVFGHFTAGITDNYSELLALIIPLLALPQVTHYVLDGFIWRISKDERIQKML